MLSPLKKILTDTKIAFILAQDHGKLDIVEVGKTAVEISTKINLLLGLNDDEKDALLLLFLKRGLSAAGAFQKLPPVEKDLVLTTAVGAAKAVSKMLSCCLPWYATKLMPGDNDLLEEAMQSHPSRPTAVTDLSGIVILDISGTSLEEVAARFVSGLATRITDLPGAVSADLSGSVAAVYSVADLSGVEDLPVADLSGTALPVAEVPVVDQSVADQSVADQSVAEVPVADLSVTAVAFDAVLNESVSVAAAVADLS